MKIKTTDTFFSSLRDFTALTCELINMRDTTHLKVCFYVIERLLVQGEPVVKDAIRENYVPALYNFLECCEQRRQVIGMLPVALRKAFDETRTQPGRMVFVLHMN